MGNRRRQLRAFLIRTQNGRCHYCGYRMGPPGSGQLREATLDEVVPQSAGGPVHTSNCVAACRVCNQAKQDMDPKAFREVVAEFRRETRCG